MEARWVAHFAPRFAAQGARERDRGPELAIDAIAAHDEPSVVAWHVVKRLGGERGGLCRTQDMRYQTPQILRSR